MFGEKAQLHTLEGVGAATLLLLVIIYAIDATSMTPLTASTASVHVESELSVLGQDILSSLDYAEPGYNSKLKDDVLNWNGKEYLWNGTMYLEDGNASAENRLTNYLTDVTSIALVRQGIAHKVELTYLRLVNNETEPSVPEEWIYAGVPSNNAIRVSRKIVLQNSDTINSGNPIRDIDPQTNLYNIVEVKLTLWRM